MQKSVTTRQGVNLHQVMGLLGAAGIPVFVLKQSPFPKLASVEIEQRPITDLDLFIRPEYAERAVALLIADKSPLCQDGQPVDTINVCSLNVIRNHHTLIYILQEDG